MTKDKEHRVGEYIPIPEHEPVAKFYVEHRTNACSDICDAKGKVYASCAWHINAGQRAERICNLLNTTQSQQELVCVCGAVWEGQELIYTKLQRPWVGLTDEDKSLFSSWLDHKTDDEVFTAIEAKLKEKNT